MEKSTIKKEKANLKGRRTKANVLKNAKGITLVALVITIIIIIILSTVAISFAFGDNGILTRANDARTQTEEAEEDELRRLTALEAATNLENQLYKDKNEDTATVPAGFAVSKVEGENTIKDGLVIIDKNGDEFVWIPVNTEEEYTKKSGSGNYRNEFKTRGMGWCSFIF